DTGGDTARGTAFGTTAEDERASQKRRRLPNEGPPSLTAETRRSGQIRVRMPASLHAELARAAAAERVSMNQQPAERVASLTPGASPTARPRAAGTSRRAGGLRPRCRT